MDRERYERALARLATSGVSAFPRRVETRDVLLSSIVLRLGPGREFTERELGEGLEAWRTRVVPRLRIDHASLRRYLVDARFLVRDKAGARYRPVWPDALASWPAEIREVRVEEVVLRARREREARRKRFQV